MVSYIITAHFISLIRMILLDSMIVKSHVKKANPIPHGKAMVPLGARPPQLAGDPTRGPHMFVRSSSFDGGRWENIMTSLLYLYIYIYMYAKNENISCIYNITGQNMIEYIHGPSCSNH